MSGTSQDKVSKAVRLIAELSIDKSSQVLSKILKAGARIQLKRVSMADISSITEKMNDKNDESIGAFIDLVGDAPFKFLFFVAQKDAFVLTDLVMRKEVGTTKETNLFVTSTVQEIANILASAISNVFSTDFQVAMKPTPPEVVANFAGILFSELILEAASEQDQILLIESVFEVAKGNLDCHMFILPKSGSEKILEYVAGK